MKTRDWSFYLIVFGLVVLIISVLLFILVQKINWWVGLLLVLGVGMLIFGSVLNMEPTAPKSC